MRQSAFPRTGIFNIILSAFLFGFTPILAKWIYLGGGNGVSLTFFRSLFALPFLWVLGRKQCGGRMRLQKKEVLPLLASGTLMPSTTLLLYASYTYIPVGISTILHFVYPLVVACVSSVFSRKDYRC